MTIDQIFWACFFGNFVISLTVAAAYLKEFKKNAARMHKRFPGTNTADTLAVIFLDSIFIFTVPLVACWVWNQPKRGSRGK